MLKDDLRSRLKPDSIRNSMYIQINMPVLSKFDPCPALKIWLTEAERRPRLKAPSKSVSYFKGVFSEADGYVDEDYSDVE